MRVLLATDSFPPACGGSGWSTYELARGLQALGLEVRVLHPRPGAPSGKRPHEYDGIPIHEFGFAAPNVPFVRNYLKNERLTSRLSGVIEAMIVRYGIDVVHGQHAWTCPPSVIGARAASRPVVCTVRDYWPVCYWSDLIVDSGSDVLCPACSAGAMTRCLASRSGAAWPAAALMIPYMRRNLARKARALARADRVIAVSTTIGADMRARCPGLDPARVAIIPNPVDLEALAASVAGSSAPLDRPYALYVGKLAPNKGITKLFAAARRAPLTVPLVVVGDGPSRADAERAAMALPHGVTFTGWLPRADVLRWMAHAAWLMFPSHGPESLSRVLLESSALGLPAAAMETGGTADIVRHGETGLLSHDVEGLARDSARLQDDEALRRRLGEAARAHVAATFARDRVVARVARVYAEVIAAKGGQP